MANLISRSYFIAGLAIPGKDDAGPAELLDLMIARLEPEFLQKALGYEMAKELQAHAADVNGIWYDLLNGKEYTANGVLCKWRGLVKGSPVYSSPIANYVYWYYRQDTFTRTDSVGENQPDAANAKVTTPIFKMVNAWNDMVKTLNEMYHFLDSSVANYPLWETAVVDKNLYTPVNALGI